MACTTALWKHKEIPQVMRTKKLSWLFSVSACALLPRYCLFLHTKTSLAVERCSISYHGQIHQDQSFFSLLFSPQTGSLYSSLFLVASSSCCWLGYAGASAVPSIAAATSSVAAVQHGVAVIRKVRFKQICIHLWCLSWQKLGWELAKLQFLPFA